MEAVKPKKKRNELELLLGAGDAGVSSAFSAKLPALSISSPTMPDGTVESDEQLARRLHEELNGMRATRRGSKALVEDHSPLSPSSRGVASPHSRSKPVTPSGAKAQSTAARGGSGVLVAPTEAPVAPFTGNRVAAEVCATAAGSNAASGGEGSCEPSKRKRNVVPARELHLLLQQASSSNGRAEGLLGSVRSARVSSAAGRADAPVAQHSPHEAPTSGRVEAASLQPARREPDLDRSRGPPTDHQSPRSAPAPLASPHSPSSLLPSQLPPKLRQRYLAGPPGGFSAQSGSASASVSNDADKRAAQGDGSNRGSNATFAVAASAPGATTVTPSGVLDGGRNSLLSGQSGQSTNGNSLQSESGCAWRVRDADAGFGAGAGAGRAAETPQLTPAGSHVGGAAVPGASGSGCSSTDETENDNENSCAVAAVCAGTGGPSATSPKGVPPPPAFPASEMSQPDEPDEHSAQQQAGQGQAQSLKVPKLPMIRAGRGWFRGRLVREAPDGQRVLVEVPGAPGHQQPVWLPAVSDRIWRGSYKGKDWKYLGDGAWEPKPGAFKRGKQGSSTNGLPLPLPLWAWGAAADVQPQPAEIPSPRRERSAAGTEPRREQRELRRAGSEGPSTRVQRPSRRGSADGSGPPEAQLEAAPSAPKVESTAETVTAPVASADAEDAAAMGPSAAVAVAGAGTANADAVGKVAGCTGTGLGAEVKVEGTTLDTEMEDGAMDVAGAAPQAPVAPEGAGPPEAALAATRVSGGGKAAADAPACPKEAGNDGSSTGRGDGDAEWEPGVPFPRRKAPRRAGQRQKRPQLPFYGWQVQAHVHQQPYHHAVLSGEESGGDAAASDAEQGANGDSGGAHHIGGRRRAAARAAAVAAAAARAEAEAEEEEMEDVLMGRRLPRRDRSQAQHSGDGPGGKRQNPQAQCIGTGNHQRSRGSAARPDYYLYGDSSGGLDESYGGEASADGNGGRQRNGSRGLSQPGSEYGACGAAPCGSAGGSPVWEAATTWQQHGGQQGADAGPGLGPSQLVRNRRKGKPCRARMDGEGNGWNVDWESGVNVWARMPEVVRRLYYTPAAAATSDSKPRAHTDGGGTGQLVAGGRYGSFQQRRSAGFYPGAQDPPSKRRRVCDDDPGFITPEDDEPEPEEEADDPDRDEDYQPPAHALSRRYSGANGGRRCSGGGGGGTTARRTMGAYDAPSWYSTAGGTAVVVTTALGPPPRCGGTSGLESLLEAALGRSCEDAGTGEGGELTAAGLGLRQEPGARPCIALFGCIPQLTGAQQRSGPQPHASHVALSDSSANHSTGEDGKVPTHMCAAPLPSLLPLGATSPPPAGGSPQPSGVLRPGTPTRARRTGRPPLAGLSAGAPLPKLPALSSSACLRGQVGTGPPSDLAAAAVSAPINAAIAAAAAAGDAHTSSGAGQPNSSAFHCNASGTVLCAAVEQAQCHGPLAPPAAELLRRGRGGAEPKVEAVAGCGDGLAGVPGQGPESTFSSESRAGLSILADGNANSSLGCSVFTSAAAGAAAAAMGAAAFRSPVGGAAFATAATTGTAVSGFSGAGRCYVMDAIDALLLERQPTMQQLALRAQFELDSVGLAVQAQHAAMAAAHGGGQGSMQRQPSSARGRGSGGAGAQRSGSLSALPCTPAPPPEALMAALPSVEVVVNLFSARMPCGGAQEALAEYVGSTAGRPLFR